MWQNSNAEIHKNGTCIGGLISGFSRLGMLDTQLLSSVTSATRVMARGGAAVGGIFEIYDIYKSISLNSE